MLSLMLIKPLPHGLNPRNHPAITPGITQNPVMNGQQEPVRLSKDRQPRRAINPETPVLLTALRPVLNPEMPALTAPQQRRKLPLLSRTMSSTAPRVQPSGQRAPALRITQPAPAL